MARYLSTILPLLLLPACSRADQTVLAGDAAFVTLVGRPYPGAVAGSVGLSWLGGGVRVAHSGSVLRATFAPSVAGFKVRTTQQVQGYFPVQAVSWVVGSNESETVAVASGNGGGVAELVLNMAPQYFESAGPEARATLLSLTTNGAFSAAPPAPALVAHVMGDSITAATNIHGGVMNNCADGGYQNDYAASWGGLLCGHLGASCSTVAVGAQAMPSMTRYYAQARYASGEPFAFNDSAPQIFMSYMGVVSPPSLRNEQRGPSCRVCEVRRTRWLGASGELRLACHVERRSPFKFHCNPTQIPSRMITGARTARHSSTPSSWLTGWPSSRSPRRPTRRRTSSTSCCSGP